MAPQFIANHNLEALLERLRRYAEVHGPVRGEDGAVRFAALAQNTPPDLLAASPHQTAASNSASGMSDE